MLYPLSYGSNHWTLCPNRGDEKLPAQPQHNTLRKVLRYSPYLSTIQTRRHGFSRTLGTGEFSTDQDHSFRPVGVSGAPDALRGPLETE
jgi:hypothetical protein